jgi:hypothetical protein
VKADDLKLGDRVRYVANGCLGSVTDKGYDKGYQGVRVTWDDGFSTFHTNNDDALDRANPQRPATPGQGETPERTK